MEISSQQEFECKLLGLQNEGQVRDSLPLFKDISFTHKSGKKIHITARPVASLLCFFMLQCIKHAMLCLEEQQDEFDFKYQTFKMEGRQLHFHFNLRTMFSGDD